MDVIEAWLVNLSVLVVLVCGLFRGWYVAKGQLKPVYWLMIVMACGNIICNVTIANDQPKYWGLWGFNILIAWTILMAIRGLRRLKNEG